MPRKVPADVLLDACRAGDAAAVSRLLPVGGTPLNLSGPRFQFHSLKSTPLLETVKGRPVHSSPRATRNRSQKSTSPAAEPRATPTWS
jgi:hypothetical protein